MLFWGTFYNQQFDFKILTLCIYYVDRVINIRDLIKTWLKVKFSVNLDQWLSTNLGEHGKNQAWSKQQTLACFLLKRTSQHNTVHAHRDKLHPLLFCSFCMLCPFSDLTFFWSKVQALNGPSTSVCNKALDKTTHCFHIWLDLKYNFIKKKPDHQADRRNLE